MNNINFQLSLNCQYICCGGFIPVCLCCAAPPVSNQTQCGLDTTLKAAWRSYFPPLFFAGWNGSYRWERVWSSSLTHLHGQKLCPFGCQVCYVDISIAANLEQLYLKFPTEKKKKSSMSFLLQHRSTGGFHIFVMVLWFALTILKVYRQSGNS